LVAALEVEIRDALIDLQANGIARIVGLGSAGAGRAIVAAKIVKAVAVADARGNFI
jgi:hypothetical protein